ncbi:MAG: nitrilase-related carbon-nitrogen hydrolase [Nitrospirales bacterium]|nr:acyltransferase [Nitrospirales bacterium]
MSKISGGFFQFSPVFGEVRRNLETILSAIHNFEGQLLVFPELAFSGYQFLSKDDVRDLAEEIPSGPTIKALEEAVRGRDLHVVVGLAERDHDRLYNSAVLIGPKGYIGTYRKTHLFFEETLWFTPGDTGFLVWDIGKAKVGLLVCFDWFFPEAARSLAIKGADILCHPSNLVLPYCPDAMVTRCLENGVFAITANRVGREQRGEKPALPFIGMSEIVAPNGRILCRSSQTDEEVGLFEMDVAEARDKRINPYNDLLKDRRPQWYVV